MIAVRRTITLADIPFGPGQPVLRAALDRDQAGVAESLTLSVGWGQGEEHRTLDRRDSITVPAGLIPKLREALDALEHG